MILQARHRAVDDLGVAAAELPKRVRRVPQLGAERSALPGHQASADGEQREGQLGEVRESGHGSCRDHRPGLTVARIAAERFGPLRRHADASRQPDRREDGLEEPGLLGGRLDEECPPGGQDGRDREPGEAAAAAQVEERIDPPGAQQRDGREAVEDVLAGDRRRLADRGQVDRGGPREQQADVALQRSPCSRPERL